MRRAAVALLAALAAANAWDEGLRDAPMAGQEITYLDGTWQAHGAGHTFDASVPGDLFTDLEAAKIIPDPLYEINWLQNSSLWASNVFNYSTSVDLSAAQASTPGTLLVFDGIKMGANIFVNGRLVGRAEDQFLRYSFDITSSGFAVAGKNSIVVSFDPSITVDGRFMACTGGWDWAPYSDQTQPAQPGDAKLFTKGIWKSVYLVTVQSVAITHIVPQVFYDGDYVIEPLKDGDHAGFTVQVRVHLWAPAATAGSVQIRAAWGATASTPVSVPAGDSNVTVSVKASASEMKLWWPAGMGEQPLYDVIAAFAPSSGPEVAAARRVGFKYFVLVTGDDTAPGYIEKNKDADGNDSNGMFFRVNGAAFVARGANHIPFDEMEGRVNSTQVRVLVQSAVDGRFNMLRVWGGGVFQYDAFYSACDELGIVIYHDMQYAQQGHSPTKTDTQAAEFRHQVRRLAGHASIGLYDGCNECHVVIGTKTGIYATFVLQTVVEEDTSHVVWPSCPSNGWKAGVNRLTSHPNGSPLGLLPKAEAPNRDAALADIGLGSIETHGPYQHGNGFPAVNGGTSLKLFDANLPIGVKPAATGLNYSNTFASEFGSVAVSSFESMSPTLDPSHWGLHAGQPNDECSGGFAATCKGPNVMAQRNYPMDNLLQVYWGKPAGSAPALNTTGEAAFKSQIWRSLISSALNIKSNIETRRQSNQFGIIVWQYGEIWPTGGWGSIEYSTPRPGQVLGGRWKPLQHWYRDYLYADVLAACGSGKCYVRNDRSMRPFAGRVQIDAVDLVSGATTSLFNKTVSLTTGPGITTFMNVDMSGVSSASAVIASTVYNEDGSVEASNVNLLAPPSSLKPAKATVKVSVADKPNADGTASVTVASDKPALWVTLTTLAHGRFSDNAFLMPAGTREISFIPFGDAPVDIPTLKATIREEDLSTYA